MSDIEKLIIKWSPVLKLCEPHVDKHKLVSELDKIDKFFNEHRQASVAVSIIVRLYNGNNRHKIGSIESFCKMLNGKHNLKESKSYYAMNYDAEISSLIAENIEKNEGPITEKFLDELSKSYE